MFTAYIDQCDNVSGERMQNYSGRKIRSFAHHTIQGGLPKLGRPVCVACRITESEQCSHQTGYWPSLEVSVANYLNFLVVGGDTDKTLPLFCVCSSITLRIMSSVSEEIRRQLLISLRSFWTKTPVGLSGETLDISPVKLTSVASLEKKILMLAKP